MHTLRGTMLCFAAKIQEMYALGLVELKWQKKKKKSKLIIRRKNRTKSIFHYISSNYKHKTSLLIIS